MARDDLKAKVVLDADTKGAEKGIKRVEGSFKKFGSWLGSSFTQTLGAVSKSLDVGTRARAGLKVVEGSFRKLGTFLAGSFVGTLRTVASALNVSEQAEPGIKRVESSFKSLGSWLAGSLVPTLGKVTKSLNIGESASKGIGRADGAFRKLGGYLGSGFSRSINRVKTAFGAMGTSGVQGVGRVDGSFRKLGRWLSSKFVFTLGDVSRAFSAITGSIKDAGALEGQTQALRLNLAAQGQSLDSFLANLDRVAQGQIAQADLIAASSQAILLGIPADKIAELLEVAAASSIATGQTITSAFNDIAVGIGRASPMILDNLGLVVKLGPVYAEAAAALGKTTEELTPLEQKMALLNSVLEVGNERIELFGNSQSELSKLTNEAAATWGDWGDKLGQIAGFLAGTLAVVLGHAAGGFVMLSGAVLNFFKTIAAGMSVLPFIGDEFQGVADKIGGWMEPLKALAGPGGAIRKFNEKAKQLAATQLYLATGIDLTGKALAEEERRLDDAAAAAGRHSDATNEAAESTNKLKEATEGETTALDQGTTALDSYFESLQQRNREEERGIKILERKIVVEKQASSLEGNRGGMNLFPGLTGAKFSFTSFTPWDELTSAQRQRLLAKGYTPPDAARGWIETP